MGTQEGFVNRDRQFVFESLCDSQHPRLSTSIEPVTTFDFYGSDTLIDHSLEALSSGIEQNIFGFISGRFNRRLNPTSRCSNVGI